MEADVPFFWTQEFVRSNHPRLIMISGGSFRSIWNFREPCTFSSGFVGPFGGPLEIRSDTHLVPNVAQHWDKVIEASKDMGAKRLEIRTPPPVGIFSQTNLWLSRLPKELHPTRRVSELDHYLELDVPPAMRMNRNRRRDLKDLASSGYSSGTSHDALHQAIMVIGKNRQSKARNLTVNLTLAEKWLELAPDQVFVSWVRDSDGKIVAASLSVKLGISSGYVVQWGHLEVEKLRPSPMALLALEVANTFAQRGTKELFLGSSSNNGNVDEGLRRFKLSLGALEVEKQSWLVELRT